MDQKGLGSFMTINTMPGTYSTLFIKKTPEEIRPLLESNPSDLCTVTEYTKRYDSPTPLYYIRRGTRMKLVEMELLTKEQMQL